MVSGLFSALLSFAVFSSVCLGQTPQLKNGIFDPSTIQVSSDNPSGINLGAVLMAIAATKRSFFDSKVLASGSGGSVQVYGYSNRAEMKNVTITDVSKLNQTYTKDTVRQWPNAYASALLSAGWPPNPDGSLAAIGVKDAFGAVIGTAGSEAVVNSTTSSPTNLAADLTLAYKAAQYAVVLLTKKNGTTVLKPNYAYAYLAGTGTQLWLGDPAIEGKDQVYEAATIFNDIDVKVNTASSVP